MPRSALAALATLLLALGAAALAAARGSSARGLGPLAGQWPLLAVAAVAAGLAGIALLRRILAETDPAAPARARLHRGALALVAVATAAVPTALFLLRRPASGQGLGVCPSCPVIRSSGSALRYTPPAVTAPTPTPHDGTLKLPLAQILLIAGIVLAVLLAAVVAVVVWRWLGGRDAADGVTGAPLPAPGDDEDDSALGMAVLAGRDALEGEARAAIIACYAAMESSLADAGVPRLVSDSPADLLARAARRGLVAGPAPRLLAELFREARFSSHAMDARHLEQARGALDEIAARLTARQQEQAAAAGIAKQAVPGGSR